MNVLRMIGLIGVAGGGLLSAAHRPLLEQPPLSATKRTNPYETPEAALAGRKLYERECSGCHGQEAQGTARAPGLKSPSVRQAPSGALFWVLRNGSLRHGMPSFSHLPEPQRWQIVTYLKTL